MFAPSAMSKPVPFNEKLVISSSLGFAAPPVEIPSISVCNSSIAACTSPLVVFPDGVKGTSAAVWLLPKMGVKSTPVPSVIFKVFPVKLRFWSSVSVSPKIGVRSTPVPSVMFNTFPVRLRFWSSVSAPPKMGVKSTPVPSVIFKVFPVKLRFWSSVSVSPKIGVRSTPVPSVMFNTFPVRLRFWSSVSAPPKIGVKSTPVPSVIFKVFPVKLKFWSSVSTVPGGRSTKPPSVREIRVPAGLMDNCCSSVLSKKPARLTELPLSILKLFPARVRF